MQSNILVKGSQVLLTAKVNYGRNDLYVSAAAMDVNTGFSHILSACQRTPWYSA
jgi:hypothetical protein